MRLYINNKLKKMNSSNDIYGYEQRPPQNQNNQYMPGQQYQQYQNNYGQQQGQYPPQYQQPQYNQPPPPGIYNQLNQYNNPYNQQQSPPQQYGQNNIPQGYYNQQQPQQNQYNQQPPQNQYNQQQQPQNTYNNQLPPHNLYNNQQQPPHNPLGYTCNEKQIEHQHNNNNKINENISNQEKNQIRNNLDFENPKRHRPNYSLNPKFIEFAKGSGIDNNEYNKIVSAAQKAYNEGKTDKHTLSFKTGREIKNTLNGQWFVFVSEKGKKYDFALSTVADNDYLTFSIGNSLFQVCRLK